MKPTATAGLTKERAIAFLLKKGVLIYYANFRRRDNSNYAGVV
jgi:hypothetical protein